MGQRPGATHRGRRYQRRCLARRQWARNTVGPKSVSKRSERRVCQSPTHAKRLCALARSGSPIRSRTQPPTGPWVRFRTRRGGYVALHLMLQHERLDKARMARIESALCPCAWRRMTVRAVASRLVEVIDGPGAAGEDNRVWMVERALS